MQHGAGLIGQTIDNQFEVVSELGRGGYGVVYLAKQELLDRMVALKFFESVTTSGNDYLERFRQEGRILSTMNHPNIMRCFMMGFYQDKLPYLVCEYLSGETLRAQLSRRKQLHWREAAKIALTVCKALEYAESNGVIHRDLKPDNIMLSDIDALDDLKVLDFGLAKFTADPNQRVQTKSGLIFGTPAYMSPQQCIGQPASAQSDLYALGIVLFEMIDGRTPFEAPSLAVTLHKHVNEQPRIPVGTEEVPPALLAIISKALAKNLKDRYQSAGEMAQNLESLVANETVDINSVGWTKAQQSAPLRPQFDAVILSLLVVNCLVICGWFVLSDPGPIKPLVAVTENHLAIPAKTLQEIAAALERLNKPAAASILYEAALKDKDLKSAARLLTMVKSFQCASRSNDSDRVRELASRGLQILQRMDQQLELQLPTKDVASAADLFAGKLLEPTQCSAKESDSFTRACVEIIGQYQSRCAKEQIGIPAEQSMPNVCLLFIIGSARAGVATGNAPGKLALLLANAQTRRDDAAQEAIMHIAFSSVAAFPDSKDWARLLQSCISSSVKTDRLAHLAISSLAYGVSDRARFTLFKCAIDLKNSDATRLLLKKSLQTSIAEKPDPALLALVHLIDARTFADQGKDVEALREYSAACYGNCSFDVQQRNELVSELNTFAAGLLQKNNPQVITAVFADLLAGRLCLEGNQPEQFGRAWIKLPDIRSTSKEILLTTEPSSSLPLNQRIRLLVLRAVLLSSIEEIDSSRKLVGRAEVLLKQHADLQQPARDELCLEVFSGHLAIAVTLKDFDRIRHYAVLVSELANRLKNVEEIEYASNSMFIADFCQDRIDFGDCYRHPEKYHATMPLLALSVILKLHGLALESDTKAQQYFSDKQVLGDDARVETPYRIRLLLTFGDVESALGNRGSARSSFEKCLKLAIRSGDAEAQKVCRDNLFRIDFFDKKLEFQDIYKDPEKYGVGLGTLAKAVCYRAESISCGGAPLEARAYLSDKLQLLVNNPQVELSDRLRLLFRAAEFDTIAGAKSAALQNYRRCLEIAVREHSSEFETLCRERLKTFAK